MTLRSAAALMAALVLLGMGWAAGVTGVPLVVSENGSDAGFAPAERHYGPTPQLRTGSGGIPTWLVIVLIVLGVVVALLVAVVLGLVLQDRWRTWRRQRVSPRLAGDDMEGAQSMAVRNGNPTRCDSGPRGRAELWSMTTPPQAIERCWARVEGVLASRGMPLGPARTAAGVAVDSGRFGGDVSALAALARLYERARFSAHETDERDVLAAERLAVVGLGSDVQNAESDYSGESA